MAEEFQEKQKPNQPLHSTASGINLRKDQKKTQFSNFEDQSIHEMHKSMRDRAIEKRSSEKKNKKFEDAAFAKREKLGFRYRFKRWWFGMAKESRRISWATPKNLVISFLIVILIVGILTALFYGINEIFISIGILKS